MPQPVDVGSTLGGRYKVTASVLASVENDLVLDGVDQVLNRSVSILLAAPENTSQVSASAREIATGERASNVQILDLGVSDGRTYLVTNTANAVDLLDLVIERDAPFIEPFFTDTLGSEIFGMARSHEPETDSDGGGYDGQPAERAPRKPLMSGRTLPKRPKFGRAADVPAETAAEAAPILPARSSAPAPGRKPKVSRWTEDDYGSAEIPSSAEPAAPSAPSAPPAGKAPERAVAGPDAGRRPSSFPRSAATATPAAAGAGGSTGTYEDYAADGEHGADGRPPHSNRTMGRVLVGAILTLVLVAAVVFAVTTLGRVGDQSAAPGATDPAPVATAPVAAPSADAPAPEAAVDPVPVGISRLVPANPALDAENDGALPQILDGNPATYWSSYVYANESFGGYAPNLALVVELEAESAINKIDITQLNGTGGSFSVLLNDSPTLEGATTVAETGFTGPTTSIQVPKTDGEAATAQYVIVNFTQLPRLSGGLQATYPWGLRIAEIGVS